MELDRDYWENRYQHGVTGWDIGYASTPLRRYFDQIEDKTLSILVPGGGRAYEVEYLWRNGFKNVYLADIAPSSFQALKARCSDFPESHFIEGDFFDIERSFDLIIEQTFFCALPPSKRDDYVLKMHEILSPGGKLVGLLFDFPLTSEGPPYGGSRSEYEERFNPLFKIRTLDRSYNSIPPRDGRELFFILEKKTGNSQAQ
ncbi:MAG: TPMT family class I SAM-dependent methyltransferase [Bacteroidota bacterium]|nr:TPMT family class I SAM-dependent methyltransferase [Bacteroidota bacterium]